MTIQDQRREAVLLLKSLKDSGINEFYVTPSSGKTKSIPVQAPAPSISKAANSLREELVALRDKTFACTLCDELARTRKNVVFGSGNIKARLMFVGEAPGADEDEQGLPFVGRAGQLLTKIIESVGLSRNQVFIANVLKCRPPQNRRPNPDEITNCQPFLKKQIELIAPDIICALGTFAAQTLLKSEEPISALRGKFYPWNAKTRLICTFHPAYLLRNPGEKRTVWNDMKAIKKELDSKTA